MAVRGLGRSFVTPTKDQWSPLEEHARVLTFNSQARSGRSCGGSLCLECPICAG